MCIRTVEFGSVRLAVSMNLFRKALKSYLTSAGEMEVAALLTD
jgi:hypothetical protein